jgi:hypothetical protein
MTMKAMRDDAEAQERLDAAAEAVRRAAASVQRRHRGDERAMLLGYSALLADACGIDPTTGVPRHQPADVLGWIARAVDMGCERPGLGPTVIERVHRLMLVPNVRLRERYESLVADEELTARDLAMHIGATRAIGGGEVGDATRVERMLGVRATPGSRGSRPFLRLFVSYEQAVRLATSLGVPYHSIGV